MTVSELIEHLRRWPDQSARVIFSYGRQDGDTEIVEVAELATRKLATDSRGALEEPWCMSAQIVEAVELV